MPSNREKVISYLGDAEAVAFNELAEKENLTRSEAVNYLIQNQLLKLPETPEALIVNRELETRLEFLELELKITNQTRIKTCEYVERLEENLAHVQEAIESLQRRLGRQQVSKVSDDEIAAITRQRVQTVWEWRHGIRKPRGEKILKALEPYKVVDGTWVKEG